MCMHDLKFLWLNPGTGGLFTDNNDDNNDNTWQTILDCIGSLAWVENQPKKFTATLEHPIQKVQNVNFFLKKKNHNLKNIGHRYIHSSVYVAPEQMHNCANCESSKSNYVGRRGK